VVRFFFGTKDCVCAIRKRLKTLLILGFEA